MLFHHNPHVKIHRNLFTFATSFFVIVFMLLSPPIFSQTPSIKTTKPDSAAAKGPKPFSEVITAKAVSMNGLLTVHRLDDKYFFEIPDSILGRDIMAITRTSKTPTGAGYGGEQANRQVIRLEKREDKVF